MHFLAEHLEKSVIIAVNLKESVLVDEHGRRQESMVLNAFFSLITLLGYGHFGKSFRLDVITRSVGTHTNVSVE